jgi:hypothetical protein
MESKSTEVLNTNQSLVRLKFLADEVLKPDANIPGLRTGGVGHFSAREIEDSYELSYGDASQLKLSFSADLVVIQAEKTWEQGDPSYYADEFDPIAKWRYNKWQKDYERQIAEGQTVLRFGDDNFAEYTKPIGPEEESRFIAGLLRAIEAEFSNPADEQVPGIEDAVRDQKSISRELGKGALGYINKLPDEWGEEGEDG